MKCGGHAVIYILVLCSGCWQLAQSCNTRTEECAELMENAMAMPTAMDSCKGMIEYLTCVQNDIADCTGNKNSDQYALNIKKLYCSPAYVCSERLRECYRKFSTAVRNRIKQSDLSTRVELCRDLMTEIMTCQENVTSECKDQTGLMETVKNYQTDLYMVCNNTDPCVTLVLQCQKSIVDIGPRDDAPSSNSDQPQPPLSDCNAQKPIDYCGAYRQAASCIRSGQSTCGGNLTVANTLANLDNTTAELCNPMNTCGQKVSSCMCHINKQSLRSPIAIMTTICSTYPAFEQCLDSLGEECQALPDINKQVRDLKATYIRYHTLYCTDQGGLCPPALQCLVQLPRNALSLSSPDSADWPTNTFHINNLCLYRGVDTLFRCLGRANTDCSQRASDVTFPMIEDNFIDMCSDIDPHLHQLSTCSNLTRCLENFHLDRLGMSSFSDFGDSDADVRHMYAGITKTEFWCNYLTHGFRCIERAGVTCSLGDQLIAESIQRYRDLQRVCEGPVTPAPTRPPTRTPKPDGGPRPSKDNNGTGSFLSSHPWTVLAAVLITVIHIISAFH